VFDLYHDAAYNSLGIELTLKLRRRGDQEEKEKSISNYFTLIRRMARVNAKNRRKINKTAKG
jgi:NRPS condensation-like uncharacterized protein